MFTLITRWFISKTVRHALDMCRQARKLLNSQRDILADQSISALQNAIQEVRDAVASGQSTDQIKILSANLEKTANQNLKPYPNASWRENVEVLLVTAAIVLAFRTFFFQPMAIPSGSAQPTLWGIHEQDLRNKPDVELPSGLKKWIQSWWSGVHYYHLIAENDGELSWEDPKPIFPLVPFSKRQDFYVGGRRYTAWFVPDNLAARSRLRRGQFIRRGEDILKLRIVSGDHLFVNCMVYNFQRPQRGEIIVFHTHDIDRRLRIYQGDTILIPDTHYIKRLVALGGEHVRIGNDRHAVIDGHRLDASTPHFENVYGFDPNLPPRVDHYSGHVNEFVGRPYERAQLAPLFPDERAELAVRKNHYLVFGDNTMNSYDGRAWGDFPREKVIGRASFVFWPITDRFGWGYR